MPQAGGNVAPMDALGYIDCGDNREEILYPWIRDKIAAERPREVLDFGCGDARFATRLAALNPGLKVTAYDRDPGMRGEARRRIASENAGHVTLCDAPGDGWTGRFDAIAVLGVWMCWRTHDECVETLGLLARSMKPGGVLIAAVTHPCFRDRRFSTYRTDFDAARYMENGAAFRVFVGQPGKEIVIEDYHWNLQAMLDQAREAGLALAEMKEHSDQGEPGPGTTSGGLPSWLSLVLRRGRD